MAPPLGRAGFVAIAELWHVTTDREEYPDRAVEPLAPVILLERCAEPAGLNAHDRIALRVKALRSPENVYRDGVSLDGRLVATQLRLDYVVEKLGKLRRTREARPAQQLLERRLDQNLGLCRFRQAVSLRVTAAKVTDLHVKRNRGYAVVTPVFLSTLTCNRHIQPCRCTVPAT